MYYLVFLILFYGSFLEVFLKKKSPFAFILAYFLMSFMAMFRYGQLADYFSYKDLYEGRNSMNEGRDPLFTFLTEMCSDMGIGFEGFIMILGFFSMAIAYPYFARYCKKSLTALLIFYSYLFLVLPMTAMRQGVCLSLLLWSYSFLMEGKLLKFYLVVLLGCFFHLSMIVVIIIPFLFRKPWYNNNSMIWVVLGMTIMGLVTPDLSRYTIIFGDRAFEAEQGSRILQILIRALLIIPVLLVKPDYKTNGYYAKAICIIGYCVYCTMSFSALVSARLEFFFRVFMCLFVSYSLFSLKKIYLGRLLFSSIIAIHVFLFFKNMDAAIQQGDYNEKKVSMFNFPYVSIFDEGELDQYK